MYFTIQAYCIPAPTLNKLTYCYCYETYLHYQRYPTQDIEKPHFLKQAGLDYLHINKIRSSRLAGEISIWKLQTLRSFLSKPAIADRTCERTL